MGSLRLILGCLAMLGSLPGIGQAADGTNDHRSRPTGRLILGGALSSMEVSGSHAYLASCLYSWACISFLHVVDVTDPAFPKEIGRVETLAGAEDVAVAGSYVLVAAGPGGLQLVAVSNPASPAIVERLHIPGYSYSVAVQ